MRNIRERKKGEFKRIAFMKLPKEYADQIRLTVGYDGDDITKGLITVKSELKMRMEKCVEDLNITFEHELPLTWADHMRKAKGLPYKSEKVYFNRWFEVEYKNIFPNALDGSGFESTQIERE